MLNASRSLPGAMYELGRRMRSKKFRFIAVPLVLALVVGMGLAVPGLIRPAHAANTVTFTCDTQSVAIALITANPPGAMSPDTTGACPGDYDGYYTPSATTTATTTASVATLVSQASGTGLIQYSQTTTDSFIPSTGCTGTPTAFGCVESCTGPVYASAAATSSTTTPSTTTGPYLATVTGSATFTGVVSTLSNTLAGKSEAILYDPCGAVGSVATQYIDYTLSSAQVSLPNVAPATGGLIFALYSIGPNVIVGPGGCAVTNGVVTTTGCATQSPIQYTLTVTGTGTLLGLSGIGLANSLGSVNGVSTVTYWVQLYNVP